MNGCSACRLLAELIFLTLKQLFPSISIIKCQKMQKITKKHVIKRGLPAFRCVTLKRWLPPKSWSTPGENVWFRPANGMQSTRLLVEIHPSIHSSIHPCSIPWISTSIFAFLLTSKYFNNCQHFNNFNIFNFSLADQKKEEGNELYKTSNYREALQRYSEAISKFISSILC